MRMPHAGAPRPGRVSLSVTCVTCVTLCTLDFVKGIVRLYMSTPRRARPRGRRAPARAAALRIAIGAIYGPCCAG